ncbi:U-box domain-containing protein 4-like [Momordica charantia]|uniref:RING-type E3 ubiquitin transferase n=1 Tax=Momordica charantia TaxID=3673 RepID=A0A6J1BVT4_MOMCH|nr:U-box domain-containing protein 4-like [Momordica charantia]
MEILALEKLKKNAEQVRTTGEAEHIGEMLPITHTHEHVIVLKKSQSCSSVPISDTMITPSYSRKAQISSLSNNVKLIDSKFENLNQSCHLRHRDSGKLKEFSSFARSREYQKTPPESTLSVGVTQENFNLGDGNHLPARPYSQLVNSPHVVAQSVEKLDFGGFSISSSEDYHNLNEDNMDISSDHLVSLYRTDRPNVTDEKSHVHDFAFSASNANPTFAQVVSRDSNDTTSPVSSVGPAGLTMDTSEEVKSEPPASMTPSISQVEPEFPLRLSVERTQSDIIGQQPHKLPEIVCSSVIEPRSDLGGTEAGVQKLVEDLNSNSLETVRAAIAELRSIAKLNNENRIMIAELGAMSFLVKFLYSTDAIIQEHAVTTLLNLSICSDLKIAIAQANAIEPLIRVLDTGSPEAKENSAATLFSLSMVEENKVKIGRSGAIGPLVELLGNGTPRGKKDATTALFYLSMIPENKVKIVQAGAVKHLVDLMDPSVGMVDKAVAVLANLATIQEGKIEIGGDGGIPVLVEAIELGSARGKENAAAALLRICLTSKKFCIVALQEGVIPPLVSLVQSGTRRAKDKAQELLNVLSKHMHSTVGKN